MLYIAWSDRQVSGSPYKVTVQPSSDASKVICSAEGLNTGMIGRDIKATLDVRRAGPGKMPWTNDGNMEMISLTFYTVHYPTNKYQLYISKYC